MNPMFLVPHGWTRGLALAVAVTLLLPARAAIALRPARAGAEEIRTELVGPARAGSEEGELFQWFETPRLQTTVVRPFTVDIRDARYLLLDYELSEPTRRSNPFSQKLKVTAGRHVIRLVLLNRVQRLSPISEDIASRRLRLPRQVDQGSAQVVFPIGSATLTLTKVGQALQGAVTSLPINGRLTLSVYELHGPIGSPHDLEWVKIRQLLETMDNAFNRIGGLSDATRAPMTAALQRAGDAAAIGHQDAAALREALADFQQRLPELPSKQQIRQAIFEGTVSAISTILDSHPPQAGLEEPPPDLSLPAEPVIPPGPMEPGGTLGYAIRHGQEKHREASTAFRNAARRGKPGGQLWNQAVSEFTLAVRRWMTVGRRIQALAKTSEAQRKIAWTSEVTDYDAVLTAAAQYAVQARTIAEQGLDYAKSRAAPPAAATTPTLSPPAVAAPTPPVELAPQADAIESPSEEAVTTPVPVPAPAIAAPALADGSALRTYIRVGQAAAPARWTPDAVQRFVEQIRGHVQQLHGAAPIEAFLALARAVKFSELPSTPEQQAARWVWDQLVTVAGSHDYPIEREALREQRGVHRLLVLSPRLSTVLGWAEAQDAAMARQWAEIKQAAQMTGRVVDAETLEPPSLEIPDVIGEFARTEIETALRRLAIALWEREFGASTPPGTGLEERTFGTVFNYALLADPTALWRAPAQWREWLESSDGGAYLRQLYGDDAVLVGDRRAAYDRVLTTYEQAYGTDEPVAIFRASGRVHWLGVHIDRPGAEAPVNRFGINGRELIMVAGRQPEDDLIVQLRSTPNNPFGQTPYALDFDVKARVFDQFPDAPIKLTDSTATEPNSWNKTAYRMGEAIRVDGKTPVEFVAGVAYLLHHGVPGGLTRGFRAAMEGNIPPGLGMSTSSALTISISLALTAVNGIEVVERNPAPNRRQMTFADWLTRTGYAEWIVRTRGGNADHRTILFSRPGGISHLGKTEVLAKPQLPASLAAVVLNTPPRHDDDDDTSARRVAAYQRGLQLLRRVFLGQETLGAIVESGATAARIAAAIRDQIPEDDPEARATTLAQLADIARSFVMRRLLEDGSLPDNVKIARLFEMTKAYQNQQRTTDYPGDPAPWNLAVIEKTGITNAALNAWIVRLGAELPADSPDRLENLATIGAYGVSVKTVDDMIHAMQQSLGDKWAHVAPIMQGVGFGGTVLTFVDTSQPGVLDRVVQFYRAYAAEHFSTAFMEPIVVTPGRGAEALVPPAPRPAAGPAAGVEEFGPFGQALSPSLRAVLRSAPLGVVARFLALQWTAWAQWKRLLKSRTKPLTVAVVIPAYAGDIPRIERQDAFRWKLEELQALAALDAAGRARFILYVVDDKSTPGLADTVSKAVDETRFDPTRITVVALRLADFLDPTSLARVEELTNVDESRKWGAVRAGMAVALQQGAEIIAMSDSDTNQRLTELPNLLAPILEGGAAAAIGSRFVGGAATTAMGIHNYLEAFLYNPFVNLAMPELGDVPIRDVQSGVKAFSASALRGPLSAMRGVGFGADAELLWLIAKAGGKIVETPRSEIEESLGASTVEPTKHEALTREVQTALAIHRGPVVSAEAKQIAARIPQTTAAVTAVVRQQVRLTQALDQIQSGRATFEQAAASVSDIFAAAGIEELRNLQGLQGAKLVERARALLETPGQEAGIRGFFKALGLRTPFLEAARAVVRDAADDRLRVSTADDDEQALLALVYAAEWVQAAANANAGFRQRAVTTIVKTMDEAGVPLVVLSAEREYLPVNAVTDLGVMAPSEEDGLPSRFGTGIKFSELRFVIPAELAAQFPSIPTKAGLEERQLTVEMGTTLAEQGIQRVVDLRPRMVTTRLGIPDGVTYVDRRDPRYRQALEETLESLQLTSHDVVVVNAQTYARAAAFVAGLPETARPILVGFAPAVWKAHWDGETLAELVQLAKRHDDRLLVHSLSIYNRVLTVDAAA